jgi:hypothetical protein
MSKSFDPVEVLSSILIMVALFLFYAGRIVERAWRVCRLGIRA